MLEAQSKSFDVDGHSVRIPGVRIIGTCGEAQYNFQDSEHTCLMHDCKERKEFRSREQECLRLNGLGQNNEVYSVLGVDWLQMNPHPPFYALDSELHLDTIAEPIAKLNGYVMQICAVSKSMKSVVETELVLRSIQGSGNYEPVEQGGLHGCRQWMYQHLRTYNGRMVPNIVRDYLFSKPMEGLRDNAPRNLLPDPQDQGQGLNGVLDNGDLFVGMWRNIK